MEEGGESSFWSVIGRLFKSKEDAPLSELEEQIKEAGEEGDLTADDALMLMNILRLGRRTVSEIMIPRRDMICAEIDDDIRTVCELIAGHGHSRIPVYRDNKDHILGVVHAKDLLVALLSPERGLKLADLLRPADFLSEEANIKDALVHFRKSKSHLAVAVDEYGGTSGVVTLEDVIEQIVGDIRDEYDALRPEDVTAVGEDEWLIAGRTTLDELRGLVDGEFDSANVDTIGGFLSELAGRVPAIGERFVLENRTYVVEDSDAKQIRLVRVLPAPAEEASSSPAGDEAASRKAGA